MGYVGSDTKRIESSENGKKSNEISLHCNKTNQSAVINTFIFFFSLFFFAPRFAEKKVNDEVANVLVAQLLYLANDDPEKDITLYINSPGGSVSAGMAIYDAMQVPSRSLLNRTKLIWGGHLETRGRF